MSMSNKDYELVAKVVRDSSMNFPDRITLAETLAIELAADNPRFDQVRFVKACIPTWVIGTRRQNLWDRAVDRAETRVKVAG